MNMETITFLSLGEKGLFLREKGPVMWQSHFTLVLLQVAFYVKARLCRSQDGLYVITYELV